MKNISIIGIIGLILSIFLYFYNIDKEQNNFIHLYNESLQVSEKDLEDITEHYDKMHKKSQLILIDYSNINDFKDRIIPLIQSKYLENNDVYNLDIIHDETVLFQICHPTEIHDKDEVFAYTIHISMYYNALSKDEKQKLKNWNFKKVIYDEDDYSYYKTFEINQEEAFLNHVQKVLNQIFLINDNQALSTEFLSERI